jgi:hypothetical protein
VSIPVALSDQEIIDRCRSGDLVHHIGRTGRNAADPSSLLNRCIALHNSGQLELLRLTGTPEFAALATHAFFTVQHFFCEAIPKLETPVESLMRAVRALVEKAGNDGAANLPKVAFRNWCAADLARARAIVHDAEQGDALSISFLTVALDALGDVDLARGAVTKYADERRLSGLFALGHIKSADSKEAEDTIALLLPFTEAGQDDVVRCNALMSVFNICGQFASLTSAAVPRVVAAASVVPGPLVQLNLVRAMWLHAKRIDRGSMKAALDALRVIDPTKAGIVHDLDNALSTLLKLPDGDLALDFLTDILSPDDSGFDLEQFKNVQHQMATGDRDRLFKLVVRWLLTGNHKLCAAVPAILTTGGHATPFNTTTQGLGLTSDDQIFLAYKAIGYLFTNPVVAASIIVASLRDCDKATAKTLGELLFDPLLVNYGGKARDYLRTIKAGDAAHRPVKTALKQADAYVKGLDIKVPIKELHPTEYQRSVERMRTQDMMRNAHKQAEKMSVIMSLVHRTTLLYGRRSITFVPGPDNKRQPVTMDLHSFSTSFELPRMEIIDPVGLNLILVQFRGAKRR